MGHIEAPKPENEEERLKELASYDVLDTLPEQCFDDITAIAAYICQTPISLVSLIDSDRQWFKSHRGLAATETPRELAFCAHAILNPTQILHVPDSFQDERFRDNPLARGAPHVRFYAGTPLVTPSGAALGTLCVIDDKPKNLTPEQLEALAALGRQVVAQLELRKRLRDLEGSKAHISEVNKDLETFTHILAHDLKTPLRSLATMAQWLESDCSDQLSNEGREYVQVIGEQSKRIIYLMSALKEFLCASRCGQTHQIFDLEPLLQSVFDGIEKNENARLCIGQLPPTLNGNEAAMRQVFLNLFSNACKYSDKKLTEIAVSAEAQQGNVVIRVTDNGPGIDSKYHTKIFEVFESLHTHDRFGAPTTGMGLAIVHRLLKKQGGSISVESTPGNGTTFIVTLPKGTV